VRLAEKLLKQRCLLNTARVNDSRLTLDASQTRLQGARRSVNSLLGATAARANSCALQTRGTATALSSSQAVLQ